MHHIYREANTATSCLTDTGHSLDLGLHFSMPPPPCLGAILRDNVVGVSTPWMIL